MGKYKAIQNCSLLIGGKVVSVKEGDLVEIDEKEAKHFIEGKFVTDITEQ